MRRILIITFYYHPDLSAGSFRMTAFVNALKRLAPPDVAIDVLTTFPNRYHSYERSAREVEKFDNVTIRRFKLPDHKSGFRDQAVAFFQFYRQVRKYVRSMQYDLVFATSSRLMTAALGATLTKSGRVPLYLDIRDIFTDTMNNILKSPLRLLVLPVFNAIEKKTVGAAQVINLVSRGFAEYFSAMKNPRDLRFFTNGIDPEFIAHDFIASGAGEGRKKILYAGNFGAGQGLHRIVPEAARALGPGFEFFLVGDGGKKAELVYACRGIDNVIFKDPVDRDELMQLYADADILFLHLNDYPAFRKVLPSKIFEYAATGKPILAGVAGYAREFIEENVENAAVFEPCEAKGITTAVNSLQFRSVPRPDFIRKYARENIMRDMASDVLALLPNEDIVPSPEMDTQ